MFRHGSYLQTISRSVLTLGDHVLSKQQSKPKQITYIDDCDESSDSSTDRSTLTRASSSPLFSTFFLLIAQSNCTRYSRHRSYHHTPTFADRQVFNDLDQVKNKNIEQPSEPMLHPVLLEPHIFKHEEYYKLYQNQNSKIISDEDKNLNEVCNFECPICLNNVKEGDLIVQAKCGHIFHHKCIQPWFVEHHSCPICRALVECA